VKDVPPGDSCRISGLLGACAWWCGLSRQAVAVVIDGSEALGSCRYASPARRSGGEQRLAVCVPRLAILLL